MYGIWLLVFCFGSLAGWSQVSDDFSDGDFTTNPTWTGDQSLFVVADEILQSNSPDAATYALATANALALNTAWSFDINLNFSTSGANYVDVYLISASSILVDEPDGYFVRLGGTSDEISFYKKSGGVLDLLIDGDDGVVGSSSNNLFAIRAERTQEGIWTIYYDENADGGESLLGSVDDNELTTTQFFGFRIVQSSAAGPVSNHFFDNVLIEEIPVDEDPPILLSAMANSATEVELIFDEPLDENSAESNSNFTIDNGIGPPIAAELIAPDRVLLTLAAALTSGLEYEVEASDVEDLAGNVSSGQIATFTYFEISDPEFKDVLFNEIMADPSPSQGLPEVEYIEIFNRSESYFDLEGWILVNTTTEMMLPSFVFQPGQHLILCDEESAAELEPFGQVVGLPSFTALSNSGDSLTLRADGEVIDLVAYDDAWYGDSELAQGGYSLELINPESPCGSSSNWTASVAAIGGTPGQVNASLDNTPDQTPPEVVDVVGGDVVRVLFSETMDENSLIAGTYTISGGITVVNVAPSADLLSAYLSVSPVLEVGELYEIEISGQTDCWGNEVLPVTETFIIGSEPFYGQLLITEIMADPTPSNGLPEAEYFELNNSGQEAIELAGVRLNDVAFSYPKVLAPGEFLICASEGSASDFLLFPETYYIPDLSTTYFTNSGRELSLFNPSGEELDRANYDLTWYDDEDALDGGYSLERINLMEPCRGGDNWRASTHPDGGTPGEVNSVNSDEPDQSPPTITQVFVRSELLIELIFDEVLDSLSVLSAEIVLEPEVGILNVRYVSEDLRIVEIDLDSPLDPDKRYTISISGIIDCSGNEMIPLKDREIGVPVSPSGGDLLLNEILFNPYTGGVDFVELVNVGSEILSLEGLVLANQDGTERIISEDPVSMLPGEYLALTSSISQTMTDYPQGIEKYMFEMESLPSFSNSEGSVVLLDKDAVELQRFDYEESDHLDLLVSFKGVSLERINFTLPVNDGSSWTSAAESVGFATPGYQNSQYSPLGSSSGNFELENKLFSPDNDGFQDLLMINYSLDTPGFIATITIYDSRGRVVKDLKQNFLLGTEGTITWDGVSNKGTKARIGPHIVFIDIFDQNGNTDTFKIPCVVAGKLN